MKYRIFQSSRFRKSLKRMLARGKDGAKLEAVVAKLANGKPLAPQNLHGATNNFSIFSQNLAILSLSYRPAAYSPSK